MQVDRSYDEIISGLNAAKEALSQLLTEAGHLSTEADSAKASLKDEVGQKDCGQLAAMAESIQSAAKPGMDQIDGLLEKMQAQKAGFDALL